MKRLLLILALLVPSAPAAAEKEIVETVTLQPQEKKEVSIASTVKVRLGWDHTDDSASSKCKKNCVNMVRPGGTEMASALGGAMGVMPADGKATVTFQNLEDFPIEIQIYRK